MWVFGFRAKANKKAGKKAKAAGKKNPRHRNIIGECFLGKVKVMTETLSEKKSVCRPPPTAPTRFARVKHRASATLFIDGCP